MNDLLSCTCINACQADAGCHFPPGFQARLDVARDGQKPPIRMRANACARHLGAVVVAITRWADEQHLTNGDLAILAIEPPPRLSRPSSGSRHSRSQTSGFVFTTIHLGDQEGVAADMHSVVSGSFWKDPAERRAAAVTAANSQV
jgi:hypothetical protein